MNEIVRLDFTEQEARAITEKIKSDASKLAETLLEAKTRKAYKALGYKTWADYVKAEFGMSDRNSRHIMNGRPAQITKKRNYSSENELGELEKRNYSSENRIIDGTVVTKSAPDLLRDAQKAFQLAHDSIFGDGIESEDIEDCIDILYDLAIKYRETKDYLVEEAKSQDNFSKIPKNAADELGTKPLTDENRPARDVYY